MAEQSGVFGSSYELTHRASARVKLRRALMLTLMTIIVPGSAQILAGNRQLGRIAIRVWIGCIAAIVLVFLLAMISRTMVFTLLTNGFVLGLVRWGLLLLAIGWIVLLFDAWRIGAPLEMSRRHRLVMTGVNASLGIAAAVFALFASNIVAVQKDFLASVFNATERADILDGRYNILLLGADSGDGRDGMRPDSITLASIDEDTGQVVLIGLPRNLQNVPFPSGTVMHQQFPQGFNCDGCFLNAVNTWANDNAQLFDVEDPGMLATKQAVEGVTGLDVHYYVMVDMRGFERLINAVGGVRIDVKEPVAIGGGSSPVWGYIEPGVQMLDGHDALWYARSREQADDYARMGRQKCLMYAMVEQLSPATVLTNFRELAESGAAMLETDIPLPEVDTLIDLALKSRSHPVSVVSLVPPLVWPGNADYAAIHDLIEDEIRRAGGEEPSSGSSSPSGSVSSDASTSDSSTSEEEIVQTHAQDREANATEDLGETC